MGLCLLVCVQDGLRFVTEARRKVEKDFALLNQLKANELDTKEQMNELDTNELDTNKLDTKELDTHSAQTNLTR